MHLYLIAPEIPHARAYGEGLEIYFRIQALSEAGVKIHLFCFAEPPLQENPELNTLCEAVYYLPMSKPKLALPLRHAHRMSTRKNKDYFAQILEDSNPILFEGLATAFHLNHGFLKYRQKFIRLSSIEWEYYHQLADRESNWSKQQVLLRESQLLQQAEQKLLVADKVFCSSLHDTEYYRRQGNSAEYVPLFTGQSQVRIQPGKGDYCLFYGDLSQPEVLASALFLIEGVFHDLSIPFKIAGIHPPPELIQLVNGYDHITLSYNPGQGELLTLMQEAHIHVIPVFQSTSHRIPLLRSLFNGRFCLTTPDLLTHTELNKYCLVAQSTDEFRTLVLQLMKYPFSDKEIKERQKLLSNRFDDGAQTQQILAYLEQ